MKRKKIRILLAKAGLDGHDRGVKVIAMALRDAGMEVIYTGLRQSVKVIVLAAVQEDVDVVAVSVLSGAHMTIFPKIKSGLRRFGMDHVLITGGGIIPDSDRKHLKRLGIGEIFGPGASVQTIIAYIKHAVGR